MKLSPTEPAPKLRFKQFEGAGEWEEVLLGSIASSVTDRATSEDKNDVLTLSGEFGLIKQGDYFGKKIAGEATERYIRILRDDFVYNDRITKSSEYGTIKRLSSYDFGIVSPIYKCFRFLSGEEKGFWQYYFESGSHDQQLKGFANEGAREGRFNISIGNFLTTHVKRPPTEEQTHIAACLSSLDAVISANQSKLEALRQHKRGLMQQLFPAEGERVPRLRFPEFAGAGDWEEKKLGEVCTMQAGKFINASDIHLEYQDRLLPCFGGNGLRGYTESHNRSGKYCIVGRQGALCGNVRIFRGDFYATEHAVTVIPQRPNIVEWLYYALDFLKLNQYATGQAQPGLSVEVLEKVRISLPPTSNEQTRIASFLSSLDDLVIAQADKIAGLQEFKRGLMQGLFPRG